MTGGEPSRALGSAYVLYERVGRGASGEVWRGLDSRTDAPVAVKLLRSIYAQQPGIVEGFLRERAILMRLHDPHIVHLRDLVVESETVALVTDFAAGGDLRPRLDGGPLPLLDALDIVCQVLDGLDAAHRRGVVHRDLKPENVLVEGAGDDMVVRITDFGIATLIGSTESSDPLSLVGSPEYMAPEVIEARQTTPAADLYSAGILLYELIAGHTPFAGAAPMAVLRRHVQDEPPRIPDLRGDVWAVIATLLAKDPAERPASARAAAGSLRAVAGEIAGAPRHEPVLDDVDIDPSLHNLSPSSVWDPSAEEDTTVVRSRRGAAAARRRRVWTATGVAVVLVLVGAGVALGIRALTQHRKSAVPHVTFVGVPGIQLVPESSTVITRSWDLSGARGDEVTVTLRVRNVGASRVSNVFEPVLQDGAPPRLFPVALPPGASTTVKYSFRAPGLGLDVGRLADWEQLLNNKVGGAARVLATADAKPGLLLLSSGERAFLNVSGSTTRGVPATAALLSGLQWSSSNRGIADVHAGSVPDGRPIVVARATGTAVLTAQLGLRQLLVRVAVTGARSRTVGTPCEPGVGDPGGLSLIANGTAVNDGSSSWLIVGGARLPYPSGTALQGPTLPADDIMSIGSIPRDGTIVTEPGRGTWEIEGGTRVRPPAATDAITVPAGSLDAIPIFGPGIALTDGTLVQAQGPGQRTELYRSNQWSTPGAVCAHASIVQMPADTQVPPR